MTRRSCPSVLVQISQPWYQFRQNGIVVLGAGKAGTLHCGAQDRDRLAGYVHQCVQRWNHRAAVLRRADRENYVNGDIKFLFVGLALDPGGSAISSQYVGRGPGDVAPCILAHFNVTVQETGKFGDLGAENSAVVFV